MDNRGLTAMTFQHDVESRSQQYSLIKAHIVTLQDVITATSLSRSTIYRMIKNRTFPQPLALTSKRCGFYAHASCPRGCRLSPSEQERLNQAAEVNLFK